MSFIKKNLPIILFILYLAEFIFLAIDPYDRKVWFAENLPIVIIVAILVFTYKKFRFSNTAYIMMSFLIFMHTIGGHYTFSRVPFDFVNDFFGFERNNFDRFAHFSVGFYAYAIAEFLDRKKLVNAKWLLYLFPITAIFTVASVYEIIEWITAVSIDPEAGMAFLGVQGDVWDAQKDMLMDGLGSITAVIIYAIINKASKNTFSQDTL